MKTNIEEFYKAFSGNNAEKMVSFYHDDIVFTDPAFGTLKGERAKNMWRMLCQSADGIKIDFSNIETNGTEVSAHWEAIYNFSQTGRKVHNKIDAKFKFKDGKIIEHIDDFNLRNWAKQALGFKGALLGGTSFFKRKLNEQTSRLLDKFESKK